VRSDHCQYQQEASLQDLRSSPKNAKKMVESSQSTMREVKYLLTFQLLTRLQFVDKCSNTML